MNLKFNNSNLRNSLFISIVFYLTTFFVISTIKITFNKLPDFQEVYLNIGHFEKHIVNEESIQNLSPKSKPKVLQKHVKKNNNNKVDIPAKRNMTIEETDSTIFSEVDILGNNINWLDSMVINNPNILMLKYAASDQLKNNPIKISDSAKTVERIRNVMQNYFKNKYPTPVHKFGDGSPGIPIDKILDIFSGSDTVDVKKIKRYLKLEGYK